MYYRIGMAINIIGKHYRQGIWSVTKVFNHYPTEQELHDVFYMSYLCMSSTIKPAFFQVNFWVQEFVENNYHEIFEQISSTYETDFIGKIIKNYQMTIAEYFKEIQQTKKKVEEE